MTARPRIERPPEAAIKRLYIEAGLSLRDTAAALGLSRDTLARTMAEYGIKRRRRGHKRSRLADYPIELLEANIKAEGLRGHARTLGVNPATLLEYIRKHRRA